MNEKKYKIPAEEIKQLILTSIGCIASDMITVHGRKIGYMYREKSEDTYDSGWRFFSEDESQDYANQEENFAFYKINTIANYDPSIIPYLEMPEGVSLSRTGDVFEVIEE